MKRTPHIGPPPHNLEAESSVLGSIMLAPQWLRPVADDIRLAPSDFYRESHRVIYRCILDMRGADEPIDTLTVAARLEAAGDLADAGGVEYVETLVERIPSIANTKQYAMIVRQHSMRRGLLAVAEAINRAVHETDDDPGDIAEKMLHAVGDVISPDRTPVAEPTEDALLWAADLAIRDSRRKRGEFDAYTQLRLAFRRLEDDYETARERRLALRELAATALFVVAQQLPQSGQSSA